MVNLKQKWKMKLSKMEKIIYAELIFGCIFLLIVQYNLHQNPKNYILALSFIAIFYKMKFAIHFLVKIKKINSYEKVTDIKELFNLLRKSEVIYVTRLDEIDKKYELCYLNNILYVRMGNKEIAFSANEDTKIIKNTEAQTENIKLYATLKAFIDYLEGKFTDNSKKIKLDLNEFNAFEKKLSNNYIIIKAQEELE